MQKDISPTPLRLIAAGTALVPTLFVLLGLRVQLVYGFHVLGSVVQSGFASAAFLCWWFALRGHVASSRGRIWRALSGGCFLGLAGFLAGTCGPMILMPDSNQGPLNGIFITGPLGFTVGVVLGAVYRRLRARATRVPD